MKNIQITQTGIKLLNDLKSGPITLYAKGTVLTNEEIRTSILVSIQDAFLKIRRTDQFGYVEIDNLRNEKGTEDYEIFSIEDHSFDKAYAASHSGIDLSEHSSIVAQPKYYKYGIRSKETHKIIVPAEYSHIEIINANLVILNNWLMVPLQYIDGRSEYYDGLGKKDPSTAVFKIAMGEYDFTSSVDHDDKIVYNLVKSEPVYNVTLEGVSPADLEHHQLDKIESGRLHSMSITFPHTKKRKRVTS